jgi:hypothetical protein
MKQRNPLAVFFLGLITLGLYSWYWAVKTKGEMNSLGENIPTAWIWLIPYVGGIWWYWKYAKAVENITQNKLSTPVAFIVLIFLFSIGQAIVQNAFNVVQPVAALNPEPGQPMNPYNANPPTYVSPTPTPTSPDQVIIQPPVNNNPPNPPIVVG